MSNVKQRIREAEASWSYGSRGTWTDTDPRSSRVKITTFSDGNILLAGIEWWDDPHGEMTCTCILYRENVTDDEYHLWREGGMGLDATLTFLANRGARA